MLGCGERIALDRFASRLKLAEAFGATLSLTDLRQWVFAK
jgi:hypothetical protein